MALGCEHDCDTAGVLCGRRPTRSQSGGCNLCRVCRRKVVLSQGRRLQRAESSTRSTVRTYPTLPYRRRRRPPRPITWMSITTAPGIQLHKDASRMRSRVQTLAEWYGMASCHTRPSPHSCRIRALGTKLRCNLRDSFPWLGWVLCTQGLDRRASGVLWVRERGGGALATVRACQPR